MELHLKGAGPNGRAIIERDMVTMSPSYTREYPLVADRALGSEVWDVDGRRYLDFMAGIGVMNVGHRHPVVQAAVQEQIDKYWHICLSDFYDPNAVVLAEKLQALAPISGDTRIYFGNSGTEAVEAAIKLAMYTTGRSQFIGFLGGFHGRTLGSLSFTASKYVQRSRYQFGLKVHHIPYDNAYRPILANPHDKEYGDVVVDYLEEELTAKVFAPEDIAGILVEPIQGEGGYIVPTPSFLPRLRAFCDKHGIMLILDEVQSGIGRTGRWWGVEHDGVEPDILCFAKGVASGFPLGGIVARSEVMTWKPGSHGSTFGGNPVATAAALGTLKVIEDENLLAAAEQTGQFIKDALVEMEMRHPSMGQVRGRGLMLAAEMVKDKNTKERAVALRDQVILNAFNKGLLLLPCGINTVRIIPPLNISQELVEEGLHLFEDALQAAEEQCLD